MERWTVQFILCFGITKLETLNRVFRNQNISRVGRRGNTQLPTGDLLMHPAAEKPNVVLRHSVHWRLIMFG